MGFKPPTTLLHKLGISSPPAPPPSSPESLSSVLMRWVLNPSIDPWDVASKTAADLVIMALVWAVFMWGLAPRCVGGF